MIKGIDVSSWQGNIDFAKVKASGIDFVIIRAGYGRETRQNDNCFELNYRNAKAAGLDVGAYWYSYAESVEDAVKEAKACMEVIKGKKFEYPIYFDLEEQSQFAKGRNFCDSIIKAFCGELEKNGYLAGLYCSTYYLNNYISNSVAGKYALWVAQYNYRCTYTANKYGIWQYSSEGRINGISGNVDMDYCYTDYPAIVKNGGYNGYKKAAKKTTTTEKKTTSTATTVKKKTVDELAKEVIAGKWAAGDERKQKLTAAGYDYNAVQKRVNEIMAKPTLKSVDEIAKEVIQGKWGNGDERKAKLTTAGYDYGKVQAKVNELMKNQ